MKARQITKAVDSRIVEEDLPVRANLKVIRLNDPDYGLTDDEIQDRNEFIRCYLLNEFELHMMIPAPDTEDDFFIGDYTVDDEGYSAFNSMDYQRTLRPFSKYGYKIKKIMEEVQDLAIQHSCISCQKRRQAVYERYERLVDLEFRYRLIKLVGQYKYTYDEAKRLTTKQKIGGLNRRILEARKIWEQYAPWDK